MERRPLDRIMPTASGIVSRAWVIELVDGVEGIDEATRRAWVDDLCAYEAQRTHGIRNRVLFWSTALGAAMATNAVGLPGWTGFVGVLLLFIGLARALATRTLRWRLEQLQAGQETATQPA